MKMAEETDRIYLVLENEELGVLEYNEGKELLAEFIESAKKYYPKGCGREIEFVHGSTKYQLLASSTDIRLYKINLKSGKTEKISVEEVENLYNALYGW